MSDEELTLALKTPENMDFYLENAGSREVIADILNHSNPESIRDQFAMAALQGILAAHPDQVNNNSGSAAKAYAHADSMMKARG